MRLENNEAVVFYDTDGKLRSRLAVILNTLAEAPMRARHLSEVLICVRKFLLAVFKIIEILVGKRN